MADSLGISGSNNPYGSTYYTPESNDKNTLTITGYFKLLAAQLQYQDMNNPMDNSEMMAQMTQMAMVQSMSAMTESIQTTSAINTQTYAAGLMGQEVTMAVTETGSNGIPYPVGVKYGKVVSVNLTSGTPTVKLEGDDKDYPLSYILGMGRIEDPYADKGEGDKGEGEGGTGDGEGGATDPINPADPTRGAVPTRATGVFSSAR